MAEITAALRANSMYAVNASTTQARDFIEAAYAYLILPESGAKGQEEFKLPHANVRAMLDEAKSWLASASGSHVSYLTTKYGR